MDRLNGPEAKEQNDILDMYVFLDKPNTLL